MSERRENEVIWLEEQGSAFVSVNDILPGSVFNDGEGIFMRTDIPPRPGEMGCVWCVNVKTGAGQRFNKTLEINRRFLSKKVIVSVE